MISADDLDFLKELPLYKRLCDGCYTSLGGSFTTVVDFSHLDSSLFPIDFISHSSPQMLALLRRLGVKCLTRCQFFRTKFLPTLSMQFRACTDSGQSIDPFIVALMALLAEVKVLYRNFTFISVPKLNFAFHRNSSKKTKISSKLCSDLNLFRTYPCKVGWN